MGMNDNPARRFLCRGRSRADPPTEESARETLRAFAKASFEAFWPGFVAEIGCGNGRLKGGRDTKASRNSPANTVVCSAHRLHATSPGCLPREGAARVASPCDRGRPLLGLSQLQREIIKSNLANALRR